MSDMVYQTASGSATAITLAIKGTLVTGYPITFIASINNGGAATTINGKKLYKPGTTTSPNLIAGKAYTVWYNSISDCFFIKASAEGTALASDVRKNKTFSNDNDTGVVGGLDLSLLVPGNIRAGVTIDGVTGKSSVVDTDDAVLDANFLVQGYSGYDDGIKKNGTLADFGSLQNATNTWTDGNGTLRARIPSKGAFTDLVNGYLPELNLFDDNFVSSNISKGKRIFGLTGTYDQLALIAGDTVLYSNTNQITTQGNSYTSVKSCKCNTSGGTIRVKFDLCTVGSSPGTAYARVYINGVAMGTIRSTQNNTTNTTYTEDFAVNVGDVVAIYAYTTNYYMGTCISNFKICVNNVFPYFG
ncbi:hypothetical protein FHU26_004809 [Clostridium beijerinckii]|nr:hypothetical protein [Clostridium beijerinckii]